MSPGRLPASATEMRTEAWVSTLAPASSSAPSVPGAGAGQASPEASMQRRKVSMWLSHLASLA